MRSLLTVSVLALLSLLSASAHAGDALVEQVVMDAARYGRTVEVANNMRSLIAYYVEQDAQDCALVSVQSSAQRNLKHFRVCDNVIKERHEVEPQAPANDPTYQHIVVSTGYRALSLGEAKAKFDNYAIHAQRVGFAMPNGCVMVNITVSYDGLLVSTDQPKICP